MFGWGSKKQSPRDAQITQLKKTYPSVHETARGEDGVFDISSRTHGGTNFTIRIFLRKNFPTEQPVILVYTPPGSEFTHPSIDSTTHEITGMDKLNRWQPHASLVEVVNEALIMGSRLDSYRVRHGQAAALPSYAPQGQAQPHYGVTPSQPTRPSLNSYASSYLSTSQRQLQPPGYEETKKGTEENPAPAERERKKSEEYHSVVLDVPTSFPELQKLSEAQLERLLNDDVALKGHMATIGAVSSMRELRESVRASNLDHAVDAMKMEEDVKKLTDECTQLQGSLQEQVTAFLAVRDDLNNRYGVNVNDVKKKLTAKASECDDRSEELGDQFVKGVVDLQTFLQAYRDLRVEYHSTDIKNKSI